MPNEDIILPVDNGNTKNTLKMTLEVAQKRYIFTFGGID